jgi:hypothetical protein
MPARTILAPSILSLLLLSSPIVVAAEPPYVDVEHGLTAQQLHETGLDSLSPAQLQALNALLRARSADTLKTVKADASREQATQEHGWLVGLDDKPLKARLKGAVAGWEPGTVFELDNGQQWKVLKGGHKLPKTMESPEVVLVPGIAGRWFLQFDEDQPKARVYLLD